MSEAAGEAKLEVKQASKEVKESENVAEKYSSMTVNMGELSAAFSALPTHKPVKKVRAPLPHSILQWSFINFITPSVVCST